MAVLGNISQFIVVFSSQTQTQTVWQEETGNLMCWPRGTVTLQISVTNGYKKEKRSFLASASVRRAKSYSRRSRIILCLLQDVGLNTLPTPVKSIWLWANSFNPLSSDMQFIQCLPSSCCYGQFVIIIFTTFFAKTIFFWSVFFCITIIIFSKSWFSL